MIAPVRIDLERHLPVSLHDGFDCITDPANWPEYWPRLVRIASRGAGASPATEPVSSCACFAGT